MCVCVCVRDGEVNHSHCRVSVYCSLSVADILGLSTKTLVKVQPTDTLRFSNFRQSFLSLFVCFYVCSFIREDTSMSDVVKYKSVHSHDVQWPVVISLLLFIRWRP